MKRLLLLCLLSLFVLSCKEQISEPLKERNEEGLFGKVKSLTETTYQAKDILGKVQLGDELKKTITSYNLDGSINKEESWEDGVFEGQTFFIYDDNTIIRKSYRGDDGAIIAQTITTLDEKGKPITIETTFFYPDNSHLSHSESYTYEYDPSNKLIKKIEETSSTKHETIYYYDEQNNHIKETHINTMGIGYGKPEISSYDIVYQYDDSVLKYEFRPLGETYSMCFEYSKSGDVIASYEATKSSTNIEDFTQYSKTEYEYDKMGNWIKALSYDIPGNIDLPSTISTRKITYY
jgi:hypothetical protein